MLSSTSLNQLILKARTNDKKAMHKILQTFSAQMKSYSQKLAQEDTLQDLTVFLIELVYKLRKNIVTLQNEKILLAYLSRSLRHKYLNLAHKHTIHQITEINLTEDLNIQYYDHKEQEIFMNDLLKELTSKEKTILSLLYFYGFSIKEIAQFNNVTRQAVNQIKNRALRKLKKFL